MKDIIANNLRNLHGRIAEVCEQNQRDTDDITLIAVSKRFPSQAIRTVVAAGIHNVGESRLQEAEPKITEAGPIARYHMIGRLQTNKVKKAVEIFDVIQSVDSVKLAEEINNRAGNIGRVIDCLIQVNISNEEQKGGVDCNSTLSLVELVNDLPGINLIGLMGIGPRSDNSDTIRAAFKRGYQLFRQAREQVGPSFDTLSMGMSHDFELAIAEGSTMIRVGTSIFGERSDNPFPFS